MKRKVSVLTLGPIHSTIKEEYQDGRGRGLFWITVLEVPVGSVVLKAIVRKYLKIGITC